MKILFIPLLLLSAYGLFRSKQSQGQTAEQQFHEAKKEAISFMQFINPVIIYAFQPWEGDRPTTTSINILGGSNRFFIEDPMLKLNIPVAEYVDSATVRLEKDKGIFGYTYLGETTNNIYVVRTTLTTPKGKIRSLLFFSFTDRDIGFDEDHTDRQKLLTLEKYYSLNDRTDATISIAGNKVIIDLPKPEKRHIELSVENDEGSEAIRNNSYPPAGIETSSLAKDWKEIDQKFYYQGKPLNPSLFYELNGGDFDMSDGPSTMAVDVVAGSASKQFGDTALNDGSTGFHRSEVEYYGQDSIIEESNFNYEYLGKTMNGVYVLRTSSWGGGSGVFRNIMFVRFKLRKSFDCNGVKEDQLLMCYEGEVAEGDRNSALVTIKGNNIYLDIPQRETPVEEATDTTHTVIWF